MAISTIQQSTEVTEVGLVTISEIVEDTENNVYIREIRVYSEPSEAGSRTLIFTLRLSATTDTFVELNAPAQTF